MTETRHKTVLEVSVKATDVEKAADGVKDLFDPDRLSDFARGVEQISRSFEFLQRNLETIDRMVTKISAAQGMPAGGRPPPLPTAGGMPGVFAPGGGGFGGAGASGGLPPSGVPPVVPVSQPFQRKQEGDEEAHKWFKRQNVERWSHGAGTAFQPSGMTAGMAGAVPYLGPIISGMLQGISQFAGSYTEHKQAIAGSFGRTGVGNGTGLMGAGADFGMGPSEVPGALGEFAQRSGMRGQRLNGAFRTQLALSRGLGISGAGGVVSAAESSSDGKVGDPSKLMMESVSSGLASGIRLSRIDEFLQNISSWTEEARKDGININPEGLMAPIRQLVASTQLRGEAAVAFSNGTREQFKGALEGPPTLGQNLRLQAAQEVLGPGATLDDIALLLENPTPELHRLLYKKAQQFGKGPSGAFAISKILGTSVTQGAEIRDGDFNAVPEPPGTEHARKALAAESGARKEAFDVSKQEARMQVRETLTGKQVQPANMRVREVDMAVAQRLAPEAAKGVEAVLEVAGGLIKGLELADIPKRFESMMGEITDAWEDLNTTYVDIMHNLKTYVTTGVLPARVQSDKEGEEPAAGGAAAGGGIGAGLRALIKGGVIMPKPKGLTLPDVNIGPHSSIGGTLRTIGRLQMELGDKIDQLDFANEGDARTG